MQNTWDLDSLLNGKSIEDLFNEYVQEQTKIIELYKTFLASESNFINFLQAMEDFKCLSNRLVNYLTNNYQEDLANPVWNAWLQKLNLQNLEFNKVFSNYDNLVIKNKEKIKTYLLNPTISEYTTEFERIFRYEPHLLTDKEEMLLSQISLYNGSIDDIYATLTDGDLKFSHANDQNGNTIEIKTQADVFKNLKSHDEQLRKTSWYSFHLAFYNIRNTLTKSLYYNYLMLNTNAKLRKFDDYITSTAFSDEVSKSFIANIYKHIKEFQPLYSKYYSLRKKYLQKMLNKSELMPWDMSLELSHTMRHFSIDEVKQIALDALSILGEEYKNLVLKAYNERWISFLPKENKQTGAYSIGGTKGLNKYFISMNYDSTIQSIFTLVHELGHSMNSYYFGQAQKIYQDTAIFYAEIASITNEMFLNHYLLKKYDNDKEMKIMILDEMIGGFFNTTSRQIVFSNFEWIANEWVNTGQPFTYEAIAKTYFNLSKEYLEVKKDYQKFCDGPEKYSLITPLRVSHFYVGNFYVYKYCIGQIAAIIISDEIINNCKNAKEKLFTFLKSGNSLEPLNTIKLLGIDFNSDEPFIKAKSILSSWINELEKVLE